MAERDIGTFEAVSADDRAEPLNKEGVKEVVTGVDGAAEV
jgi:hypothetical protein